MGSEKRSADHYRSIRAAITWLHKHADSMNDPHAKALLNTAAFNLGVDKPEPSPEIGDADVRGMVEELKALGAILRHKELMQITAARLCDRAATALERAQAEIEGLKRERDELRLAICGGEDDPGYNASLSHETILWVLAENYNTARRDSELAWDGETANSWKARAEAAEALLAKAGEALGPFSRRAPFYERGKHLYVGAEPEPSDFRLAASVHGEIKRYFAAGAETAASAVACGPASAEQSGREG